MAKKQLFAKGYPNRISNGREKREHIHTNTHKNTHIFVFIQVEILFIYFLHSLSPRFSSTPHKMLSVWSLVTFVSAISQVKGHGYVDLPPGRSSLWRHVANCPGGYIVTPNYNDNQLNCGGRDVSCLTITLTLTLTQP